ncbi:hypothetical protein SDC9_56322 [bioreactor metagenome]|uniref:Uncharacterized protein n=1 Tax=bioreactor metagenome TaxID=1076179 RepID=A0A644X2J4_9ZZZZ
MGAKKSFGLNGKQRIAFQTDVDGCTAVQDSLIDNFKTTQSIVNSIIDIFGKQNSAGSNFDTSLRNVHGIEGYFVADR